MARDWTTPLEWTNEGTEPSSALKASGFVGGSKPAASTFNYFLHRQKACIDELQTAIDEDEANSVGKEGTGAFSEIHNDTTRNEASANFAYAEGQGTTASGNVSHSEGYGTTASGANSHAEGMLSKAQATTSHAEGYGTIASSQNSHVQGKYNIEDTDGRYAHIIGNGLGSTERSNCHTVTWTGNAWYAGSVKTGQDDVSLSKVGHVNIGLTLAAGASKTYRTEFSNFAEGDFTVFKIRNGSTFGVTSLRHISTYFTYTDTGYSVKFYEDGTIVVTNTGSASISIEAEFLVIRRDALTLTEQ